MQNKTIKPVSAGGQGTISLSTFICGKYAIAGGEKYIVQGIFFKFALGTLTFCSLGGVISPNRISL